MRTTPPAGERAAPRPWLTSDTHARWAERRFADLLAFVARSAVPGGGFAYLDGSGHPMAGRGPTLLLTARMVHASAIGVVAGIPGAGALLDHGMASLAGPFRDARHGGFVSVPAGTGRKATYEHVHVALAAASACAAAHPAGPALLAEICGLIDERLWREDEGALAESFAADWGEAEPYRGANANMHGVEAFLALGDVTGDPRWHERAERISRRLIDGAARAHGWLLPEHYDADWRELLDYHVDDPHHPFRPYGATPGHALEWARLLCALAASPHRGAAAGDGWLVPAAANLARVALSLWGADGREGLCYTVDWAGTPVSTMRLHWPVCEGIQATAALWRATGDPAWEAWYRRLWDHAAARFIDPSGSWINELGDDLTESGTVWPGRPDVYHTAGAYLAPLAGLSPFVTLALARR